MSGLLASIGALVAGFLLGALPFGLWWGRLTRGIDIREHGSRNLGATNVLRVLGPGPGIAVLLLDIGKGSLAVLCARWLGGGETLAVLAGLAAVAGHIFSPWVRFRGGKGVATGLGVWLLLVPAATALGLGVFAVVLAIGRRVSAASLLATLALVPGVAGFARPEVASLELGLAAGTTVLVWMRHRANIVRLLRRQEPPLWGRGP